VGNHKSIILYADLARAVRRESSLAIRFWWGVSMSTVRQWRRALEVPRVNEGSRRLWKTNARTPASKAARRLAWQKARDPARCEKIAESKRGKPMPAHVLAALRKSHLGKPTSDETRAKQSAAHRARGTRAPKAVRPWTPEEDELVRTLPPAEVVQRTGRTLVAVWSHRAVLGLPDGRRAASK
jgi:hypothetical protein